MSWSRNIRHMDLGILARGPSTNEVSDTASIRNEQDIRGDEGMSSGSPSGITKDHPFADDQGGATALGSSSGKNMA